MSVAIIIGLLLIPETAASVIVEDDVVVEEPMVLLPEVVEEVEEVVIETPRIPVMKAIAICESGDRQFKDDGTLVRNPKSSAVGKYQIMASIHEDTAFRLGHNIYTEEGNEGYANHLYDVSGTLPWEADPASHACWSKLI